MTDGTQVALADLPEHVRAAPTPGVLAKRERRKQLADDLYAALVERHYTFWEHIHALFLRRDMTRHDLRQLMNRGFSATRGNYHALLKLFGMPDSDYKRLMNFLAAHDCVVDFRQFRVDSVRRQPPLRDCRWRKPKAPDRRGFFSLAAAPLSGKSIHPKDSTPRPLWRQRSKAAFDSATRRQGCWDGASSQTAPPLSSRPVLRFTHSSCRSQSMWSSSLADGRVLKTYAALPAWRLAFAVGAYAVIEFPRAHCLVRSQCAATVWCSRHDIASRHRPLSGPHQIRSARLSSQESTVTCIAHHDLCHDMARGTLACSNPSIRLPSACAVHVEIHDLRFRSPGKARYECPVM